MKARATIAVVLLTSAAASAQAPPPNPLMQQGPQATVRCAPVQPPIAGQGNDKSSQQTIGESRETLSDRLARSDGIMCPPSNIDPQMQKEPPDEGKTPVIPPPGSPGGDPNLRPK